MDHRLPIGIQLRPDSAKGPSLVTGAFLSLGFFDLYYALIAVIACTEVVVKRELAKLSAESAATQMIEAQLFGRWDARTPRSPDGQIRRRHYETNPPPPRCAGVDEL